MSDMDDEEYDSNASFEDQGSDDDDAFDDTPDPTAKEAQYTTLDPEQCRALASKAVKSVVELLCCDEQVAQMLLRQYKWDQDKLVEGAPRPLHFVLPSAECLHPCMLSAAASSSRVHTGPAPPADAVGTAGP